MGYRRERNNDSNNNDVRSLLEELITWVKIQGFFLFVSFIHLSVTAPLRETVGLHTFKKHCEVKKTCKLMGLWRAAPPFRSGSLVVV